MCKLNMINKYCMECFPELVEKYGYDTLSEASSLGTYVFHEDYFNLWVIEDVSSDCDLSRVADYIEHLASSSNVDLQNLAQIGIIEGLMNFHFEKIASYLQKNSRKLLIESEQTTHFNKNVWSTK